MEPNPGSSGGVRATAQDVAGVLKLCAIQAILMLVASIAFISSESLSKLVYQHTQVLSDVPILARAASFYANGRLAELPTIHSIFLSNLVLQAVFLSIVIYTIFSKPWLASETHKGLGRKSVFFFLIVLSLLPNIEMLFGAYGDKRFGSSIMYFLYAFLAPAGNALFYFLIYSRFQFRTPSARNTQVKTQ